MSQEDIDKLMNGDVKPEGEMNMERVVELEKEGLSPDEIYLQVREHLRYNVIFYGG